MLHNKSGETLELKWDGHSGTIKPKQKLDLVKALDIRESDLPVIEKRFVNKFPGLEIIGRKVEEEDSAEEESTESVSEEEAPKPLTKKEKEAAKKAAKKDEAAA